MQYNFNVPRGTEENEITETKSYSMKANLALSESNVIFTYFINYILTLRPPESLGLLNYGRPFFPIYCILSPSLNLYLLQNLLYIFQPSQTRSSPSSISLRFTLKYFLNSPSLIHSYYISNQFQSLLFNIC